MSSPEAPSFDLGADEVSKRKVALLALLAEQRPTRVWRLFHVVSMTVALLGATLSQLPLSAKIALFLGAYLGQIALLEVWWLRRRFEAAIELLGLSQDGLQH